MHSSHLIPRRGVALLLGVLLVATASAAASPRAPGTGGARLPASAASTRSCLALHAIFYDPPGHDRQPTPGGEWVQLVNTCRAGTSLEGWKVTNGRGARYLFGAGRLPGGGIVRVYTGEGASTKTFRSWDAPDEVWDDGGGAAALVAPGGNEVDSCSYDGGAGNVTCTRYRGRETDKEDASFRVECEFSHRRQADPIVAPGPEGTRSSHVHDFFGNRAVDSDSTYGSSVRSGTTCGLSDDTAGYWVPSLVGPRGGFVQPDRMIIYYRSRPGDYGTTVPFPPDLRIIAGGEGSYPHAYWNCDGQSDSALEARSRRPPDCGSADLKLHVYFPSCWDGLRNDSADHRSHVAYGFDDDNGTSTDISDDVCPKSHPVKIPQVHLRVLFPVSNGPVYSLSDGTTTPHADFWNTWRQGALERLVARCLERGRSCDLQED